LPKKPFIIAISCQIIANIPTTLFIKENESNLLPKQLLAAKGFNHFFCLHTIKHKKIGAITIIS
jgi:hypothetical protein